MAEQPDSLSANALESAAAITQIGVEALDAETAVEMTTAVAVQEETQTETNVRVAKATGVLAMGNIASRVLGMAREVVMTNLFGASIATDAFYIATIIPKTLYDLLIAGHVNGAIIPVLSEVATRNKQEFWRLTSVLLTLTTVITGLLTILLTLFAPQAVSLVSSGADEATFDLAVNLLRLTSPALILLGLFSILSGALYALRSFTWPAFSGVVFNGAIVVLTFALTPLFRPNDPTGQGIQAAAMGWVAGSLGQLLLQTFGLRGAQLRINFNFRHPAVKQVVKLYIPVMFSLIVDTLIVRTFSYNLASQTGTGSLGYMNWATTLIQFPQGLVATAISIAILPTLARQALIATETKDETSFRDTLGLGLRLSITLILPATVGLFVLAQPIISLLFERGEFTPQNTLITMDVLRLYLIGLPFAAVDLLLVYAFYARKDTLTPALIGVFSLIVYMIVAIVLLPSIGLFSLMIADSVKHVVHASISSVILWRRVKGLGKQRITLTLIKAGTAALVMGIVAALVEPIAEQFLGEYVGRQFFREVALVVLAGGLSVLVYGALAWLFKLEEFAWIVGMIRSRLPRRLRG